MSEEEDKSWDSFEIFISLDLRKRNVFIFFGISRHKISKKRENGCFKFKHFWSKGEMKGGVAFTNISCLCKESLHQEQNV